MNLIKENNRNKLLDATGPVSTHSYDFVSKMRHRLLWWGPLGSLWSCTCGHARWLCHRDSSLSTSISKVLKLGKAKDHGQQAMLKRRLISARVYLDFPSPGATEYDGGCVLAERGTTILENVSAWTRSDLASFLNRMGGRYCRCWDETIKIHGVKKPYMAPPMMWFRTEVKQVPFMVAAAGTQGDVLIEGMCQNTTCYHWLVNYVKWALYSIVPKWTAGYWALRHGTTNVKTLPYPGF